MNNKFKSFSSHHNDPKSTLHYNKIIPGNKRLYSVSNKTNGIEIGLQLYNQGQISHMAKRAEARAPEF